MNKDRLQGFAEYLESIGEGSKLGNGTKNSYVTYMNSLCRHVLDDFAKQFNFSGGFLELVYSLTGDKRIELLEVTTCYLKDLRNRGGRGIALSPKALSNYSVGFKWFAQYMSCDYEESESEEPDSGGETELAVQSEEDLTAAENQVSARYNEIEGQVFTNKELVDIYINRLKTQDRREYADAKIGFPIRVIRRLASNIKQEKKITDVMKETIAGMIYYVSTDGGKTIEQIKHSSIRTLVLENKNGRVCINGNKILYTEKYTDNGKNEYGIQRPIMSKISIDHQVSMHTLLTGENFGKYPKLEALHRDMQDFPYREKTVSRKSTEFCNAREKDYDRAFVEELIKEVCILFGQMQFIAMDFNENSRKNKKV